MLAFPVNAPVKLVELTLVSPLIVVLSANVPVVSVRLLFNVTAASALEVLKYARTSPLAKPESVKPVKVGLLPVVKPLISAWVGCAHTFPFFQNWLAAPAVLRAVAVELFPVSAPTKVVELTLVRPVIVVFRVTLPVLYDRLPDALICA